MKNRTMALALMAGILSVAGPMRAEETKTTDAIKHPELTYDRMKIKKDQKDVHQGEEKAADIAERRRYAKEWVGITQRHFEKTRTAYGPDNELTVNAKAKYEEAMKESEEAKNDQTDNLRDLRKDKKELGDAKEELSKDKRDPK